jgi:integrase
MAKKIKKQRGSVILKRGSRILYVSFRYRGRRVEKSTGLPDTPDNRDKLRMWLDRIMDKIDKGTFIFSDAFPAASEREKSLFCRLEGRDFRPKPDDVLFGPYCQHWMEKIIPTLPTANKRHDYSGALSSRILPYFEDFTFREITRDQLAIFIGKLFIEKGSQKGKPLSRKRINNLFIPFRKVWESARNNNDWDIRCPFYKLEEFYPKKSRITFEEFDQMGKVFRVNQWTAILENIDSYHKPIVEIMIMTGLIASELAGIRREDIRETEIWVRNSIVRGHEKEELKTEYRFRRIPKTQAIKKNLEILLDRTEGEYPFRTVTGLPFSEGTFRKNYWTPALKKADVAYKVPYSTRHTFAAWSLTIGVDPNRLVRLMGHGSKKMIYEVYGNYVEGLEKDKERILDYFGEDFLA